MMRFNHLTGLLILASLAPLSSSQCPPMWTYYEDVNGTEAHDSCLALFSTQTSSPLPAGALASLCNGFGGHLLTILSSVPGSGIVGAAAGLISGPAIIGCQQTASASQRGAGWRWADDTDGLNINPKDLVSGYDGGNGNGIWSCGEPNDGGRNGTQELHLEDTCALYPNGTLNDVSYSSFAASNNVAYICEMDLACPGGWTRYVDDGSEGHDSCLILPLNASSNGPALVDTWATTLTSNPLGSHLLTVISPKYSPNSAMALAVNASIVNSGHVAALASMWAWVGCTQGPSAPALEPLRGLGWYWIDGTSASNLNCGATGCGWWSSAWPPGTSGVQICVMNFVNSSSPTGYHIGQLLGFESPSVVGGFPMVYEQDISPSLCPFGWTYYQDNGTEGTDSCLYIPRSGSTGLYSTSWISASRVCPVGSHLLSVRSSSVTSGLLPFATSLTPDPMFLGCYENGSNWYWFDGTSRNNVDASACGLSPCPLWLVVTTQAPMEDDDDFGGVDADSVGTAVCTVVNAIDRYTDDYNAPKTVHLTQYQSVCEMEVSARCPFGWAYYVDDGSEGTDSCVQVSSYVVSNWTMASQSCPAGSHLLTVRASRPSALMSFAYAISARLSPFATDAYPFIGCSQAANANGVARGWSWVDGTDPSNLNCGGVNGSSGCGAWQLQQPNDGYLTFSTEKHIEDYCNLFNYVGWDYSLLPGINDCPWNVSARFICEMELPTPSPSPTPTVTPSVTLSVTRSSTYSVTASPSASASPICPPDWTYYADVDGSEGHDSCIAVFATASSTTGLSALSASCQGYGGHLLTLLGTNVTYGLPTLATSVARYSTMVIGCHQSPTAVAKGMGWQWIDGTNALNINCAPYSGGSGCGLWATQEPDDGGLDGVFELHVEDGCGLMSNGSINDISLSLPANTPFMCEIDLQCPGRWIRYVDDGSEGHDSCLTVGLSPYTQFNGLLSYPGNFGSWLSAVNSAPPGSHLITVRSSSHSFALNSAIAAAAAGSGTVAYLAWTGAVQSVNAADFGTGWSWMDGTPSANLNCDNTGTAAGCDLWYPQYPTNSWYGSFHRSVGAVWIVNGTAPSSNYVGDFFNLAFSGGWSMPSLVERDIAPTLCPPGWTYYQDNGTEGVDSCLYIPQSNQSSWLHSVSACPVGSHLLSIRSQSRVSGLLPFATSLTPLASFIGCYQDSMTQKWFWLDGTSAANLNHTGCSGITCPIWSSISILAASGSDDFAYLDASQPANAFCYVSDANLRYNQTFLYPSAFQPVCEVEVSPRCPFGWAYYVDDGSEGSDSCVQVSSYMVSNWTMASQSCPIGSHLLTVRASRPSALVSFAYAISLSVSQSAASALGANPFIGCFQAYNATRRSIRWDWIDGTDSSNLNCGGGSGCGAWFPGQPDNLSGNESYCGLDSFASITPGVNDVMWLIPSWFICEMEVPSPSSTPSPSPSPLPSPSPSPSPTVSCSLTALSSTSVTPSVIASSSANAPSVSTSQVSITSSPSASASPSISASNTPTISVSDSSSVTPTPSPAYPVNAPIAHHIAYVAGEWSVCSSLCHGWSYRSVTCLIDGAIDDDGSACVGAGLVAPLRLQQCNNARCTTPASWSMVPWAPCSFPCMNGSDVSLGVATRNASTCVDASGAVVNASRCLGEGLSMPPNVTACNRFPCPSTVYAWSASAWSLCQSPIGCGVGNQSRTVTCQNSGGSAASASYCTGSAPNTTQQCDTGVTCGCTTDSDCSSASVNSQCDISSGKCMCKSGWIGVGCDVIQLLGNSSTSSCSGVLDAAGKCCAGTIDSVTGVCCGSGIITDAQGRCCDGVLDVCGVCNGTGVSVDRNGVCCDTSLSASGVCCAADDCGVCDGLSACAALCQFTFLAPNSSNQYEVTVLESVPSLASLLDVSSALISNLTYSNLTAGGVNESVVSFTIAAEANIATSTVVSVVASTSVSLLGINVTRVAVCPNQHCEVGEACVDVTCSTGCPADCPAYQGNCPLGLSADGNVTVCSNNGRCLQGTAQCVCHAGYSGNACSGCAAEYIRIVRGGPCIYLPGSQVSCYDGVKDGNELGVDCGGPNCSPCPMPSQPTLVIVVVSVSVVSVIASLVIILKRRENAAVEDEKAQGSEFSKKSKKVVKEKSLKNKLRIVSVKVVPLVKHVMPAKGRRASAGKDAESEEIREPSQAGRGFL